MPITVHCTCLDAWHQVVELETRLADQRLVARTLVQAVALVEGGVVRALVVGVGNDGVRVDPEQLVVGVEGAVGDEEGGVVVAAAEVGEDVVGVVVVAHDDGVAVVEEGGVVDEELVGRQEVAQVDVGRVLVVEDGLGRAHRPHQKGEAARLLEIIRNLWKLVEICGN